MRKAIAKQQMVADRNEDIDVIGIAEDELEAAMQVFYVRRGRVVGRKGFVLDKVEELTPGKLVDRILEAMYGDEPPTGVPKQVLVPVEPDDRATYEEWLSPARESGADPRPTAWRQAVVARHRDAKRQRGVHPPPPSPGERSQHAQPCAHRVAGPAVAARGAVADRVLRHGAPAGHRLRRLDGGGRGRLPNKREYRRFRVKDVPGNDDYAAMEEVLTRRLTAYLAERDRPIKNARAPRQVRVPTSAARRRRRQGSARRRPARRESLGLADEIPVAGLAKRFEEVFVPGRSDPVEIPRGSEALFMLQRIRDEAHRFANTFHVERRSKRMTASSLDGIPGLGETRKTTREGDGRGQRREARRARGPEVAAVPPRRRRRGDPLEVPPRVSVTGSGRARRRRRECDQPAHSATSAVPAR